MEKIVYSFICPIFHKLNIDLYALMFKVRYLQIITDRNETTHNSSVSNFVYDLFCETKIS